MTHKAKNHIDEAMPGLKRRFQANVDGSWTDEEVKCMLDSVQTSVESEYVKKTKRVSVDNLRSILATAAVKASLESQESSMLATTVNASSPTSKPRFIFLEFDDGSNVSKTLAAGASFYIGREAHPDAEADGCRVFKHADDNIWRRVSLKHCKITNEEGVVKLFDTSTNGTWVNDIKIHKAGETLKIGDKVKLYSAKNDVTVDSAKFTVLFLH